MNKVYIITASDSSYYEDKKDLTGPLLSEIMKEKGYEIVGRKILPDDRDLISNSLRKICDEGMADLILTNGGTGFGPRDITPEATMDVMDKFVPGFGELMRRKSQEITKHGILSREISVIRKSTLIINLPGSPKAAKENLEFIIDTLDHALKMIKSVKSDCANMGEKR